MLLRGKHARRPYLRWDARARSAESAREQVNTRLTLAGLPILAQCFKQFRRERQVAISRALPLMHVDQHERSVDVADLQPHRLGAP
jgi:hypothetical protein